MCPNVVLPVLLEVEDGAWTFTVVVSVTGDVDEDDNITPESDRCRDGLVNMGGYVSQWSKNAEGLRGSNRGNECYSRRPLPQPRNRSKLASKREIGKGGRSLGSAEESFIGLTVSEPLNKAQPTRAQSGTIFCGPQAGPVASQAHETVAPSSSSRQQAGSSAKAIPQLASTHGPVEGRAGVVVLSGEDGRAFEIKAQSPPILSPPSDEVVGCVLKGPSRLGQSLKGKESSVEKDRSRREEDDAAVKGKAPEGQSRGSSQKEELVVTKRMWTTLFPPSSDHRQERRSRSEPIFPVKPPSVSEARPLEKAQRFLSLAVICEIGGEGKGPRRQVVQRFCAINASKKTKKVLWAEWGQTFVVLQSRVHFLVQKSEVKGSSLRGFPNFREWKIRRYVCPLILSLPSLLLPLIVVSFFLWKIESLYSFLRRVPLVQIFSAQSIFLNLLWKIKFFLKFWLIKTLWAIFFKIMLAFLSMMRWRTNLLFQTRCQSVLHPVSLNLACLRRFLIVIQAARGILWSPLRRNSI
ncbi:hypothetical protein PVL29_017405 [Vitis rotundifolia]|uniref:Uncharacterized protein n=1 Tax=Vitis rotundifolia TaxID=103349 RepID=A0AA38ZB88_VITRO|nr:hypothetical protein PVL29_017405 [Vitis rotundifolia]